MQNVFCAYQIEMLYMQTSPGKGGAYLYDIHFWLGKDTSQVLLLFLFLFSPLGVLSCYLLWNLNFCNFLG